MGATSSSHPKSEIHMSLNAPLISSRLFQFSNTLLRTRFFRGRVFSGASDSLQVIIPGCLSKQNQRPQNPVVGSEADIEIWGIDSDA